MRRACKRFILGPGRRPGQPGFRCRWCWSPGAMVLLAAVWCLLPGPAGSRPAARRVPSRHGGRVPVSRRPSARDPIMGPLPPRFPAARVPAAGCPGGDGAVVPAGLGLPAGRPIPGVRAARVLGAGLQVACGSAGGVLRVGGGLGRPASRRRPDSRWKCGPPAVIVACSRLAARDRCKAGTAAGFPASAPPCDDGVSASLKSLAGVTHVGQ